MGSFMRDTLRGLRVRRDKNFDSPRQSIVSTESKEFVSGGTSSPARPSTDVALLGGGGGGPAHPWRVTANNSDPVSWDVVGDPVWTGIDGNSINTLWFSDAETGGQGLTNVVGDAGYILLKITRDVDSREATEVSLEFANEVPESDCFHQYRVIAYVDSEAAEPILQKQFEEIRIFEDMAVVNGAFQLVGLEMSHRNYYDLPE